VQPNATAEIFVTAFKSLKRRQREAVLERMLADAEFLRTWRTRWRWKHGGAKAASPSANFEGIEYRSLKV